MNALTWLVVGSICGVVATFILRNEGNSELKINIIAGIVGAIAAGIYITPLFEIETINQKAFRFHAGLPGRHGDNHMACLPF